MSIGCICLVVMVKRAIIQRGEALQQIEVELQGLYRRFAGFCRDLPPAEPWGTRAVLISSACAFSESRMDIGDRRVIRFLHRKIAFNVASLDCQHRLAEVRGLFHAVTRSRMKLGRENGTDNPWRNRWQVY